MRTAFASLALLAAFTLPAAAHADTLFTSSFAGYSGNLLGGQSDTGATIAYGGYVPGWTAAGFDALHGVESANGQWAPMFYYNASLTLNDGIAGSNVAGSSYQLTFDFGTACYYDGSQCTYPGEGLLVQLLDPSSNMVAEQSVIPGGWGAGNYDLEAGLSSTLSYTGTGSGDLVIEISDTQPGNSFGGSIDNLELTSVGATPEPSSLILLGSGILGIAGAARRRLFARQ